MMMSEEALLQECNVYVWNILYDIDEDREDELAVSDLYSQQVFDLSP